MTKNTKRLVASLLMALLAASASAGNGNDSTPNGNNGNHYGNDNNDGNNGNHFGNDKKDEKVDKQDEAIAVSEPEILLLIGAGFAAAGLMVRVRRRRN